MKNIEKDFLGAIKDSFDAYNKSGARSNKKLIPIHKFLGDFIEESLGKDYCVKSLGKGGEAKLEGKYYKKTLDITISKKEKILATISFKFVTSNYKQNGNNYFEQLMGETANIRRVNVGFAHFLVLRAHTPYLDKNKGNLRGITKKIEKINEKDLMKYIKLFEDLDFPHKPDILGIAIIDIDDIGLPYFVDFTKIGISSKSEEILKNELSLEKFMARVVALCQLKS